ncbi:C1q-like domain-containing protein [Pedobacter xixiisoli]|uniref:C1q domain-containing protein n=1 Tax=Pedobacter xixiisoli TaxID=1476464 RepID=A0A286AE89_9SPHI|nr:hypothetical protein [Pedobacter xixiisoli]SOD20210.1 C1q domain-containing protein [Pedobacter xixiisoli]
MKKIVTLLFLVAGFSAMAQNVGINVAVPKATLDVAGTPATVAQTDGFIPPSLTRAQLITKTAYGTDQAGTFIYVSDVTGTTNAATANVIAAGYYSFDGTKWVDFRPKFRGFHVTKNDNIVKSSGTTGPISFTHKVYDNSNWFDLATGQFKPTMAGYYQINASMKMQDGNGGEKSVYLMKNGLVFYRGTSTTGAVASSTVSAMVYLNGTTDFLTLTMFSPGATTTDNSPAYSYFQGYLVSAQ